MHSLKPTGDNIAQEFFNILKKASAADSEGGEHRHVAELEELSNEDHAETISQHINDMLRGLGETSAPEESEERPMESEAFDDMLDDMIMDDEATDMSGPGKAFEMIDTAVEALENNSFDEVTLAEKRVLDGLSKIASGLRSKGKGFAADVVLSTANSIRSDISKEASHRARVKVGLQKVAKELYEAGDQLAGDMVQVTINKLAGLSLDADFDKDMNDAFKELDEAKKGESDQDKLISWACADDDRGKKIRADWTKQAETDKAVAMLMMQSKQKCPTVWKA